MALLQLHNFFCLFLLIHVSLEIHSSILNIDELQHSMYGVEISAEPVLLNIKNDINIMKITSKHGQQYQCILPVFLMEKNGPKELNVTTEEINILLQPFNDTCLTQINGWWSYKVCFGDFIYQYHEEGKKIKDVISLGNYTGSTIWSNITIKEDSKGEDRYHSQFYDNGTICDLTGQPRKSEVRFFCSENTMKDAITRIDESSTCSYIINIHTKRLCNHTVFRPSNSPTKQSITCSPALNDDQYLKYKKAQSRSQKDGSVQVENKQNEKGVIEDKRPVENVIEDKRHVEDVIEDKRHVEDVIEDKRVVEDVIENKRHVEDVIENKRHVEDVIEKKRDVEIDNEDGSHFDDIFLKPIEGVKKLMERKFSSNDGKLRIKKTAKKSFNHVDVGADDHVRIGKERGNVDVDDHVRIHKERGNVDVDDHVRIDEERGNVDVDDHVRIDEERGSVDVDDHVRIDEERGNVDVDDNSDNDYDAIVEDEWNDGLNLDSLKKKRFSRAKTDSEDSASDYYHELINHLKIQFRFHKKYLDSVTRNMKTRISRLEKGLGSVDPNVKKFLQDTKKKVHQLEHKQSVAEDAMSRLSDLYDAVMEDPNYLKASEELGNIKSILNGLINNVEIPEKIDEGSFEEVDSFKSRSPGNEFGKLFKKSRRGLNTGKPNLDKVVSRLKKIMTGKFDEGERQDNLRDDQISVRVTKIKETSEDLHNNEDLDNIIDGNDEGNDLDHVQENAEMKEATKKMESIVRKQLENVGVKHNGKIKVKIITSREALKRVAGGKDKFQLLSAQETNQFRDLLSSILGGGQQLMEEQRRQEMMEDNYNLVWKEDGFTSVAAGKDDKESSIEQDDHDNNR